MCESIAYNRIWNISTAYRKDEVVCKWWCCGQCYEFTTTEVWILSKLRSESFLVNTSYISWMFIFAIFYTTQIIYATCFYIRVVEATVDAVWLVFLQYFATKNTWILSKLKNEPFLVNTSLIVYYLVKRIMYYCKNYKKIKNYLIGMWDAYFCHFF